MRPGEFLSDRLGRLLLQLLFMAAMAAFLLATGTARGVLIIFFIAWCLLIAAIQASDYLKCRAHLRELDSIMEALDQKYLFPACAPKPQGAYERRFFDLMRRAGRAMLETVSNAQVMQREYREYIESWVHEIKTPITAAQLICRNADAQTRRKLLQELAQIDNHVERALFYARAESAEKDFIIRQTDLSALITQAIERHQSLLIQNSVRVETNHLDHTVYTDSKWAGFMLSQLLQNAVRYRNEFPVVTLSARQLGRQVQLTVADNGIGISPHELPRIFERGFTGANGRARGGSTGMGLYLCRRLADFLEIDFRVQSEEGRGTSAVLTFPAKESLSKM